MVPVVVRHGFGNLFCGKLAMVLKMQYIVGDCIGRLG
jgi:hypothetical protein